MKKGVILLFALAFIFVSSGLASAVCELDASLINQDPYPAIPGDYVKLVFQLDGIENPECGTVSFELLENYPISFDPGVSSVVVAEGGTFQRDYNSYLSIPYKVRIDRDALDGETPIEVRYGSDGLEASTELKTFYLEIEEARADFEIHVDKYSYDSKELTLEVLNTAENDVEALVLEIPPQEGVKIIGTDRVIVGDLDSNEYTTADFKAELKNEVINVNILYTDSTGTRRSLTKEVDFNSDLFEGVDDAGSSWIVYVIILIVVIVVIVWYLRRRKKKKEHKHKHHRA